MSGHETCSEFTAIIRNFTIHDPIAFFNTHCLILLLVLQSIVTFDSFLFRCLLNKALKVFNGKRLSRMFEFNIIISDHYLHHDSIMFISTVLCILKKLPDPSFSCLLILSKQFAEAIYDFSSVSVQKEFSLLIDHHFFNSHCLSSFNHINNFNRLYLFDV
jgi:hypothetical protein